LAIKALYFNAHIQNPAHSQRFMNSTAEYVSPADLAKTEYLDLISRQIVEGLYSGGHRSKRKGGSAEFAEHRAYSPGDEIRLLDWRVYGKSDRYYIKQFEEETSLQAMFVLDASGSMDFGLRSPTKYAYSRMAGLCLARVVLRQSDAAGLAIIGENIRAFVPPRNQPRHLEVLIQHLREAQPSGPTSVAKSLGDLAGRIKRRGLIALFSDCFDQPEQLAHSLKLLRARRHEVILFHVLAPEELAFSFQQLTRFESMEGDGQMIDLDPGSIRREYLERMQIFLGQVRRACGEAGCDYVPLRTDKPVGDALADYLRRRVAFQK
jgi:uncharacterized protein (DUF58 family)